MIPKLIHKIWVGPNEDKLQYSQAWKTIFPHHTLVLWDNNTAGSYIKEMITLLNGVPKYSFNFVSDMLRLLIIRDYGGIYLDHDVEIFKNFENVLRGSKTFLTFQYPICDDPPNFKLGTKMVDILSNGIENLYDGIHSGGVFINKSDYINACFIVSEPNSPLITRAIELYVQNYLTEDRFKYPMSDWGYGPQVLSQSATEYSITLNGRTQSNDVVTVFERSLFHPLQG